MIFVSQYLHRNYSNIIEKQQQKSFNVISVIFPEQLIS